MNYRLLSIIILPVVLAGILWVFASPDRVGMTWDEAYYYPTYVDASEWTGRLVTNPGDALSEKGIKAGWEEIHELPPLVKWLGAFSVSLGGDGWGILWRMRLIPAVAFGACLLLLYLIGRRLMPEPWALLPPLLYLLHPRILGHAQIAATETIFAAVNLFVLWAALHDLGKWKWRIVLIIGAGLALATKVNGIILLAAVLFWLATRRSVDRGLHQREKKSGWKGDGLLILLLLILSPLAAWVIWPWMWDDTFARIAEYIRFIREHFHQGLWYFGQKWNFDGPRVPVTYPFVISHLTTPVILLIFFWLGIIGGGARLIWRRKFPHRAYLLALLLVAPLVAASLPNAPRYDGIRLFFPVFAPAALVAALGMFWFFRWGRRRWQLSRMKSLHAVGILGALAFLLTLPQVPSLDYYNRPARWIGAGEAVFPFEQTYWGNALNREVIEDLNDRLPPEARVKTLALQPAILDIYQRWGVLREDIEINPSPPYDVHLMQNRRGFWGNAEWSIFTSREPLATWGQGAGGEAKIFLYDGRPPGT